MLRNSNAMIFNGELMRLGETVAFLVKCSWENYSFFVVREKQALIQKEIRDECFE